MENEITTLVSEVLGNQLILATIVAILVFILKDFIANVAKGISFKLGSEFSEGDIVYIDKTQAIIVDVGLRRTKFQFIRDGKIFWRYVPNSRIEVLNISKRKELDLDCETLPED